jgi:hypothetical protein
MEATGDEKECLLSCLTPILTKPAAQEIELLRELSRVFPHCAPPETLKQIRALRELVEQFPGLTLADIAKIVRSHVASANNSPSAVATRIKGVMEGTSDESVSTIDESLRKMAVADLKKLGHGLGLELDGVKGAVVATILEWIESGGSIRPRTKAEIAAEEAEPYIAQARPLMKEVNPHAADKLLAILRDVTGDRSVDKDGLAAFLAALDIPVSGSKAQMRKQAEDFIKRLSVTWVQTHS